MSIGPSTSTALVQQLGSRTLQRREHLIPVPDACLPWAYVSTMVKHKLPTAVYAHKFEGLPLAFAPGPVCRLVGVFHGQTLQKLGHRGDSHSFRFPGSLVRLQGLPATASFWRA